MDALSFTSWILCTCSARRSNTILICTWRSNLLNEQFTFPPHFCLIRQLGTLTELTTFRAMLYVMSFTEMENIRCTCAILHPLTYSSPAERRVQPRQRECLALPAERLRGHPRSLHIQRHMALCRARTNKLCLTLYLVVLNQGSDVTGNEEMKLE